MKYLISFILLTFSWTCCSQESISYCKVSDSISLLDIEDKCVIMSYYGGLIDIIDTTFISIQTPFKESVSSYSLSKGIYPYLTVVETFENDTLSIQNFTKGKRFSIQINGKEYEYVFFIRGSDIVAFSHQYGLLFNYNINTNAGIRMISSGVRSQKRINPVTNKIFKQFLSNGHTEE